MNSQQASESENRKLKIANQMVSYVKKDDKRPYATLEWVAKVIYQREHWESYFIAVNILKQRGVENAKRKPLTNLTQKERAEMRKIAKSLAKMISEKMGCPANVQKNPIRICPNNQPYLAIACHTSKSTISYIHPSRSELQKWDGLSECEKIISVTRLIESRFQSYDKWLENRIDVIKADLEMRLEM